MASNSLYLDGDYSRPNPTGARRFTYPFRMNGDIVTAYFAEDYWQNAATYSPQPFSIPHESLRDFYLIGETQPVPSLASVLNFTRTWSRIPATQTVPTSLQISKPAISGTFPQAYGSYRLFQPDTTLLKYDAYAAQTVTSDSGVPGALYPTGGTYTLTFDGYTTTAIAYNASAATLQTALNLLTSISNRGSVVVTGTYNSAAGFTITFNSYATATIDITNITADGSGAKYSTIWSNYAGYQQVFQIAPGFGAANINGGTFTITIFGQTTAAIAYNATPATVAAALNALSEVQTKRGGCTVAIGAGTTIAQQAGGTGAIYVGFTVNFSNAVFTSSAASLTPSGSSLTPSISPSYSQGSIQTVIFSAGVSASRQLGVSAHGLITTDTLYIKADGSYVTFSGTFQVPSADIVLLIPTAGTTAATATAITEVGKRTKHNYQPGTTLIRANQVTAFYLPGVTSGITTTADIPLPTLQSDDASFLQAIFAGTGTINYIVGQWQRWMDSPIISQATTQLSAADV